MVGERLRRDSDHRRFDKRVERLPRARLRPERVVEVFSGYSEGDGRDSRGARARSAPDATGDRLTRRDPLAHPERLIRSVYAYVAYRIGPGPDAEDVTSEVFERALRYRGSYDPKQGEPMAWLIGIARRCISDVGSNPHSTLDAIAERAAPGDVADEAVDRLSLAAAVTQLGERDRELIALRYGADLTGRQIGAILDLSANAVDVAVHRAVERLRQALEGRDAENR